MNRNTIAGFDHGRPNDPSRAWVSCGAILVLTLTVASPVLGQGLAPGREAEPIVIDGSALADWLGATDITTVNVYAYDGNGFDAIPFQVDKKRKVNLDRNKVAPYDVPVCEYGYFPERFPAPGIPDPFASDLLAARDELVFMLKDAGTLPAPVTAWVEGTSTKRYEIILKDGRTGVNRYVYVFDWQQAPPDLDPTDYVVYTPDVNPPVCPPVAAACGTAEAVAAAFPGVPTHRVHFGGNWITDAYRVREGATAYEDFIDRFRYNVPSESETSWSNSVEPIFLGTIDGKIRVVRAVQGAQSGVHTTKHESVYGTQFVTRLNMRVHPLNWLEGRLNHDAGIVEELRQMDLRAYLWTETKWDESEPDPTPFDLVDGLCGGFTCPLMLGGETVDDWTEAASEARGTYIHLVRELRPIPSTTTFYRYQDAIASGRIGEHGRRWELIGNTQDGIDNDGCTMLDPESSDLHFARVEQVLVPRGLRGDASDSTSVVAFDYKSNSDLPMLPIARVQTRGVADPPPVPTCPPILSSQNTGTGSIHLDLSAPQCPGVSGFRVYRAVGDGPLAFLRDVGNAATFTDATTRHGESYRYVVTTYNAVNDESAPSQEVVIVALDTTPPSIPGWIEALPGNMQVTIEWDAVHDTDILGYDVHVATTSGGPYSKLTASPLHASENTQWTQAGLQNGMTYYFTISTVDIAGNQSAMSSEATVTPGP